MTPTSKWKEKAPQEEERPEEPWRRGPFGTITNALQEIQEHFGHTRSIVRAAYAMVGANGKDQLLEALDELPHKQAVLDLEEKDKKLQEEVNQLKDELEDEKKTNVVAATKLSKSLDLIRKMEGYVQQPGEVVNKARLFNEGLAKNPVTATKVTLVLVDFN